MGQGDLTTFQKQTVFPETGQDFLSLIQINFFP